jgi:hypothetical protein
MRACDDGGGKRNSRWLRLYRARRRSALLGSETTAKPFFESHGCEWQLEQDHDGQDRRNVNCSGLPARAYLYRTDTYDSQGSWQSTVLSAYRLRTDFCILRNGSSSLSAVLSGEIFPFDNSATKPGKQVQTS